MNPWTSVSDGDLIDDCSFFLQLSVAQGAPVLGKTMSVSRSYAGSMVVSGMRTQRMGRVSATSAARVFLEAQ